MIPSVPFAAKARAEDVHLRLVATTDLHMHVFGYDYYLDQPLDTVGLARVASLIEDIRAASPNVLLLDNGDYLQGNPMGDYIAQEAGLPEKSVHPIIAAMNLLGYDAGTVGNHEFDYGIAFMDQVNAGATYPIVCANFARKLGQTPLEDDLHLPPFSLLKRQMRQANGSNRPVTIGVIGFVPPQVTIWDKQHLKGQFATRDIVETAEAWLPEMKRQGADVVVALCHSGITCGPATKGMENAGLQLAAVAGVDALVLGHQHRLFPDDEFIGDGIDPLGKLHHKPATMPGYWGSHLGLIDLLLRPSENGWQVVHSQSATEAVIKSDQSHPPRQDRAVLNTAQAAHDATLDYIRRPVGQTSVPLHSYFALVASDPTLELIAEAQLWFGRHLLKEHPDIPDLPLLAAASPYKSGGFSGPRHYVDIPPGPIAIRNVADLYQFPNKIQILNVSGQEVCGWLERAAGVFQTLREGQQDQNLIQQDFPSHNFDVIHGLTYEIDLSVGPRFDICGDLNTNTRGRIRNLRFRGEKVTPEMRFLLVTNNYRGDGGGAFPGTDGSTLVHASQVATQDVIIRYVAAHGDLTLQRKLVWSFSPMPHTSAIFESGAESARFAPQVAPLGIEALGSTSDGFAQYRLWL